MPNVTIALDERTLSASREYARRHGTTLNSMIRQFLRETAMPAVKRSPVDEFLDLTDQFPGDSGGWRWNREELYDLQRIGGTT
jgi:hypothetical protein